MRARLAAEAADGEMGALGAALVSVSRAAQLAQTPGLARTGSESDTALDAEKVAKRLLRSGAARDIAPDSAVCACNTHALARIPSKQKFLYFECVGLAACLQPPQSSLQHPHTHPDSPNSPLLASAMMLPDLQLPDYPLPDQLSDSPLQDSLPLNRSRWRSDCCCPLLRCS
ncbi:hypothetical protein T492DRAFT_842912 [Pavlovales sp. CCMP2436]|nr:hypothetical protein T492DRAFT_842912 [Pavlovales sp. CCMP2436]